MIEKKELKPVTIKNAKIRFLNFSGIPDKFNANGNREFTVMLEPDIATILEKEGYNVKHKPGREDGDEEQLFLKVGVKYEFKPPSIYLVTGEGDNMRTTLLNEATVGVLDSSDIVKVDLIVRAYYWEQPESMMAIKSGYKTVVKSMYVTIYENELMQEYRIAKNRPLSE